MRRAAATVLILFAAGCGGPKPAVAPDPPAGDAARLAAADALVRAGCFDCLAAAYRGYDALRGSPVAGNAAAAGAARAATLLAIRERELGTEDSGYLKRARELIARTAALEPALNPLLEIADTLPVRGGTRQVSDDVELGRMQTAFRNRAAWIAYLKAHANDDPLASYLWLAFNCAYTPSGRQAVDEWSEELTTNGDTPLIALKKATCGTYSPEPLEQLLAADPRFAELNYFLGLAATFSGKIDAAIDRLTRAYAWRERWPAVTTALASAYVTLEEFDRAIEFYDRTLAVMPQSADALLGKIKALTYGGRHEDAIRVTDQLLALEHWYIGDARYWRALNETQMERYDEAWTDIELANKLLLNAEVPKLAGVIAYRRKEVEVSRAKFELSRTRNPNDCETGFYLQLVDAELTRWSETAEIAAAAAACFVDEEAQLNREIADLRTRAMAEDKRAKQIAKREKRLADDARMRATSWYNAAVANFNLKNADEAKAFAEKVVDDEQFGDRARDLLARIR